MTQSEIFRDIVNGYSKIYFNDEVRFFKHFSIFDQVEFEEKRKEYEEEGKNRGLFTEEEGLEIAKNENLWTKQDEGELFQCQSYLKTVKNTKKSLFLQSQIDQINKDIAEYEKKEAEILKRKNEAIGDTCEKYASRRVSDFYLFSAVFEDKEFTRPLFKEDGSDDISREDISKLVDIYNKHCEDFDEKMIQNIVLSDFFSMYMPFCENVRNFFDKPMFEMTSNQVKLVVLARMFKMIFENYPKIPDNIRKDGDKIIDYVNSQEKMKNVTKNMDKDGASTIVGATEKDYQAAGYNVTKGKSLSKMLKESGGNLDMGDLMKMMEGDK